jgi:hypothetical protein
MPSLVSWLIRVFSGILGGVILSYALHALVDLGMVDSSFLVLLSLANIFGVIFVSILMGYWGTLYVIGWLLGLMSSSPIGIADVLEFFIYFLVALVILLRKLKRFP